HLVMSGEVREQFPDPPEVAAAHFLHHEGVGCVQHERVVAQAGLQWLQPGVDVLGRVFGFEALETTGPGIHGHSMGRTTNESAARIAGNTERAKGIHEGTTGGLQRGAGGVTTIESREGVLRTRGAEHSSPEDPWRAPALQLASEGTSSRPRASAGKGERSRANAAG